MVLAEHGWGNGSVFNSLYDGREGRPAAHLVIAWPHGVPVVDGMVDTFNADGNMSVVSLANAVMHNATELGACIYATEKTTRTRDSAEPYRRLAGGGDGILQSRIRQKMVCRVHLPSPCLYTPPRFPVPWSGVVEPLQLPRSGDPNPTR